MADDFGMGYALGQDSSGGNSGGFGGFGGDGIWAILLFAMIFGYGRNGFGGGGGYEGGSYHPWATQADVRAAVDQQTLISKLDQQTYPQPICRFYGRESRDKHSCWKLLK